MPAPVRIKLSRPATLKTTTYYFGDEYHKETEMVEYDEGTEFEAESMFDGDLFLVYTENEDNFVDIRTEIFIKKDLVTIL